VRDEAPFGTAQDRFQPSCRIEVRRRFVELGIDMVCISDDLGTQAGLMLFPEMIRRYLIPRYRAMFYNWKKAGAYVFLESCGNIEQIVRDLRPE
jgi:hypothetical protein